MFVLRLLYPSSGGYMYPIRGIRTLTLTLTLILTLALTRTRTLTLTLTLALTLTITLIGMLCKAGYDSPYALYDHIERNEDGDDEYRLLAGFPPHPVPDASLVSRQFERKRPKRQT